MGTGGINMDFDVMDTRAKSDLESSFRVPEWTANL